ncbi:helix-turn-helix domain-containing protein [Exiguobacterium alkaliphilum]|uniref:Tetratricopeptide repeat protein n=1 Tax=Exiguobacterium alkaliphilum TaxID=1428684 RepID=A0ABT2L2S2_9BACL|nr:tetratricopeptide repeat protein [Exiguobacterium alkaliphilum]MCT4796764.1 tetratricopeptide repeat protein [Exiguobacterium alkaliphilum]
MEYNYGNLIKVERMRKNMKQSVLARGICSISYLSKIENNQTSPSEEVLELIFERLELDVPLYFDLSEQVQKIKNEIREILKEAILSRRDQNKNEKVEKYISSPVVRQSKDLYITLMMTLARFGVMPDGNPKYLTEIGWIDDQLDSDNRLRYLLLKCISLFQTAEREEALEILEKLNKELPHSHIPDWEMADMRYIMGGLYYKSTDYLQAIEHVRVALGYFQEHFHVERIIECHLIIGLSFKRRKRYTDALAHYEKATKVASATDLKNYNGMLYNNMGDIYFLIGDQERALKYFLESFEYKVDVKSKLYSVMSLIEVNAERKNTEGVVEWLSKGYELMAEREDLQEFDFHFDIYVNGYRDFNQQGLLTSLKKAVQYFEAYDEFYTNKYALWLARELRENGKYKLATEYYEKSIAIMSRWD